MIYRCGSLVVTIAYLRLFSLIPFFILLLELGLVSWIRFRRFIYRKIFIAQIMISNIGVLNSYAFLMDKEEEDEEDISKFIVRSSVIAFIHHTILIVIIMVIGYLNPDFFVPELILKPSDQKFYIALSSIIVIGAMSLAINIYWFKSYGTTNSEPTPTQAFDNEIVL